MAGYIFNLHGAENIERCFNSGCYATAIKKAWKKTYVDSTFADYLGMKGGDNVYLFCDRMIYGIGELISPNPAFKCFPNACDPDDDACLDAIVAQEAPDGKIYRWGCLFIAAPHFFKSGIDMDDALSSDPEAFKELRAFSKRSFIKIDDFENQALKNALLYKNMRILGESHIPSADDIYLQDAEEFGRLSQDASRAPLDLSILLDNVRNGTAYKRESVLECNIILDITCGNSQDVFGHWDYVSHQVMASPFKPIEYTDHMDIFGYEYIPQNKPAIAKYKVCELKKDCAGINQISQCMKYVDWLRDTYAHGDYSKIKAFLVAHDFSVSRGEWQNHAVRSYVSGVRDLQSNTWDDLTLVRYEYNEDLRRTTYTIFDGPNT